MKSFSIRRSNAPLLKFRGENIAYYRGDEYNGRFRTHALYKMNDGIVIEINDLTYHEGEHDRFTAEIVPDLAAVRAYYLSRYERDYLTTDEEELIDDAAKRLAKMAF